MKKIAITGSNGLLGQTLVNLFLKEPEKYQVYGLSRGENRSGRSDFQYTSLDITHEEEVYQFFRKIKPDVIVNTAAMTMVDLCEDHPEECDLLNVEAVRYLKNVSEELKAQLIHISTDFIFDGMKGYYKETDKPNPLSYYGLSKLKSEQLLIASNVHYTILRTILVYGKVNNLGRNNIVLWIREMLSNQKEITIVDDQFRMPTYVKELAVACQLAIDKKATGIYHISSRQLLSVFEIAQQIAEVFGLNQYLIKPISSKTLNQRAKRPSKTGFDLSKSISELGFQPNTFREDLQKFKETLG